jgi:hypothetical protein
LQHNCFVRGRSLTKQSDNIKSQYRSSTLRRAWPFLFYKMKNISDNYIVVQGWMVDKLNLSGNELLTFALIYGFCQDKETEFKGSINYICTWLNCSRPTASKALKDLTEKSLLIKTEIYTNGVQFNTYKINLEGVKKLYEGSKETLWGGSKETLHNTDNLNTDFNNIDLGKKQKSFKQWSLEDLQNEIKEHKTSTTLDTNDLLAFYDYWRELTPTGKMKFQIEKTWQTDLRLKKWERGKKTFAKPETSFKSNNKAL